MILFTKRLACNFLLFLAVALVVFGYYWNQDVFKSLQLSLKRRHIVSYSGSQNNSFVTQYQIYCPRNNVMSIKSDYVGNVLVCFSSLSLFVPSESKGEWAPPYAPGGVATPSHLPPRSGADVGAADAAGGQTSCPVIPSASQQTLQPGRTATVNSHNQMEFPSAVKCTACLTLMSVRFKILNVRFGGWIKGISWLPGGGSPEETWPAGGDTPQRTRPQKTSGEHQHPLKTSLHIHTNNIINNCHNACLEFTCLLWTHSICQTKPTSHNPRCLSSRGTSKSASSSRSRPRTDWRSRGNRWHAPRSTTTTTTSSTVPAWWGRAPKRRGWVLIHSYSSSTTEAVNTYVMTRVQFTVQKNYSFSVIKQKKSSHFRSWHQKMFEYFEGSHKCTDSMESMVPLFKSLDLQRIYCMALWEESRTAREYNTKVWIADHGPHLWNSMYFDCETKAENRKPQ